MSFFSKFGDGALSVVTVFLKTVRYAAEELLGLVASQKQPIRPKEEEKEDKSNS